MENSCCIKCLKDKFVTFISLQDVLDKEKNKQPLIPNNANDNVNNINNNNSVMMSSFIPLNVYPPMYNSGIVNNPNIPPVQVQPMQMQPINPNPNQVPPAVDINQPA